MDLEQKLEEEIEKNIWSKESIDRVRKVVELIPTRKNVPYRLFEEIEDYQLYYELHPEWKGKSNFEMQKDTESGGSSFYQSLNKWIKKRTNDKEERKRLRQSAIKYKGKWISFTTINDWITEYESHPEWNNITTNDMFRGKEFSARKFYQAFYIWTISQTEDKKEQNKLRQMIFKPYESKWSKFKTMSDWIKKYESHPEWNDKSISEMKKDTESGGRTFYNAFYIWTISQTEDKKEQKKLRQTIFKPKQKTIDDWIKEFESHPKWNGKSTYEIQKDTESGARAFYYLFISWTNKQTEDVKERKELRRKVFPNLR